MEKFTARLISVGGQSKNGLYANRVIGFLFLDREMRSAATKKAAASEIWEIEGEMRVQSMRRGLTCVHRGTLCDIALDGLTHTKFWDEKYDEKSGLWIPIAKEQG